MKTYTKYQNKIQEVKTAKEDFLTELQMFIATNFGTLQRHQDVTLRNCIGVHIRQLYGINVEDVALVLNKPYGTVSSGLINIAYDLHRKKQSVVYEMEKVKSVFGK